MSGQFREPPSALVIIATNGSPNEFSPVVEYTKVEFESGLALKVVLSNGQTVSIPKGQIAEIFKYPDPNQSLTDPRIIDELNAAKKEAMRLSARYSKAKPYLVRVLASLDSDLARLSAGQVRYQNQWISRIEFERKIKELAAILTVVPALVNGGRTLNNVRVTSVYGDKISVLHEGGIATITASELTAAELNQLKTTAPLLFSQQQTPSLVTQTTEAENVTQPITQQAPSKLLKEKTTFEIKPSAVVNQQSRLNVVNTINEARATITVLGTKASFFELGPTEDWHNAFEKLIQVLGRVGQIKPSEVEGCPKLQSIIRRLQTLLDHKDITFENSEEYYQLGQRLLQADCDGLVNRTNDFEITHLDEGHSSRSKERAGSC